MRSSVTAPRRSIVVALLCAFVPNGRGASLETLTNTLSRSGSVVARFWTDIATVSCTESVEQLKIDPKKDKVLNEQRSTYDYLLFLEWIGNQLTVDESRELRQQARKKKVRRPTDRPLLVTNGFALFLLIFHPRFQTSYKFEDGGIETLDGHEYRRIEFEHLDGAPSPSGLRLEDRLYPIEWRGEAWIDPMNGQAVRLHGQLKAPMVELGLQRLDVDVDYAPIPSAPNMTWMPTNARVEAATEHQVWRNEHHFADYRRFEVNTTFDIGDPEQK